MSRSVPETDLQEPLELTEGGQAVSQSFKTAYRRLRRLKGRETHRLDGTVTHAQFELLVELRNHGPKAVGELAQAAGLTAASVSQMVDRLADDGFVERVRSDEDRRRVSIELSARGREMIDPVIAGWREKWHRALDGIPEDDLQTASRVIDRIAGIYDLPEDN